MVENNNEDLEVVNINSTDPIVWHDPVLEKERIAKLYVPPKPANGDTHLEDYDGIDALGRHSEYDQIKTDGIRFPILQINNTTIESHQIESIKLEYKDFTPYLKVVINDSDGFIKFKDIPGSNNIVKLVIIPPKDGVYRKISLSFKIISFEIFNNNLYYKCEYKLDELNKDKFESVYFCKNSGCEKCNKKPNPLPNTWECLHEISSKLGLGFASTQQCKDIEDNLPRLIQNVSYNTFINNIITYGGFDENSIFDCWIDLYGYLVMVNLPYIFNSNIQSDSLELVANVGIITTENGLPDNKIERVKRVLTNGNNQGAVSNMSIKSYQEISNPGDMHFFGNLHSLSTFMPLCNNGVNNLVYEDIQSKEDSVDGEHTEEYTISQKLPLNICYTKYNTKRQEDIRNQYITKIKSKGLEVILNEYNLGLQRGTLVNVVIFENDMRRKSKLLRAGSNALGDQSEEPDVDANDIDTMTKETNMVLNTALSGLYYIDGMEFVYDKSIAERIEQKLILLKIGNRSNLDNKYTPTKIKFNE
jgi:hypothetical protein